MNTSTTSLQSITRAAAALALALAVAAPVHAAESKAAKPVTIEGVGAMEVTRITASVEAIDLKNRIVVLKGPRGNLFATVVSDRVKNLAQVKVGDTLEVDHYESVAVAVKNVEGVPSRTTVVAATKAAPGQEPGAAVFKKVSIVTNILGINTDNQSVLVRGPLGHLAEVKIKDPKVLAGLKTGGQIDLTYVEGLVMAVTPGAARK